MAGLPKALEVWIRQSIFIGRCEVRKAMPSGFLSGEIVRKCLGIVVVVAFFVAPSAWGVTVSYKVESGGKSVTLTNDYDLDPASSSHSTMHSSVNSGEPAVYQDRTMHLEGDNHIEQTTEGKSGGEDNYTGVDIIDTKSAVGVSVTTQSYSESDTHSLGQTLNGEGDEIYSVLGAGDIDVNGSGVNLGPGSLDVDVKVGGNGAVVGMGIFGNAQINDSTLCVETGHSSHAMGEVDAVGDMVVAGAAAGKIDADAEGSFSAAPLNGSLDAEGEVEAAGAAVGASGGRVGVKSSLGAETSDGTKSWVHVDRAKGGEIGAGVVAGRLEGDVSFDADMAQGTVTADGELNAGLAGSAIVTKSHHHSAAMVRNASLDAEVSDGSEHTDMHVKGVKGNMVGAGSVAGQLEADASFNADMAHGTVTADGELNAGLAGSAIVTKSHHHSAAMVRNASLDAEVSDGSEHTDMHVKGVKGNMVGAGSVAGQ